MKVMIAISSKGTLWPNIVSENTSLGFGHGTLVETRTVMYEIRKQPKMKVSLSRKIHIIGLPQGTFLKTRWSDDMSAVMLRQPSRPDAKAAVSARAAVSMAWCVVMGVGLPVVTRGTTSRSPAPVRP